MFLKLDTLRDGITKRVDARNLDEFNYYVDKYKTENPIILTKSKNISQETLRHLPASSTWKRDNKMEFHYIDGVDHIRVTYAIAYDEHNEKDPLISVHAINYFKGLFELIPTDDIEEDSDLFTCPENPNSAYYNYCNDRYTDFEVSHCYSLDRNSAFLASMVTVYPQTRPFAEKFQADKLKVKAKPESQRTPEEVEFLSYDKIIIGWLKNSRTHRLHAWKKIISESNRVIHQLRKNLEKHGNTILLVNTDAVKFIGSYPYSCSTELGGFKYEWIDTKMYIKGVKSYAYKDGDIWKFKQAGKCKLDYLKSRTEWSLEDFKNGPTEQIAKIIIKNGRLIEIYETL